MVSPFGGVDLRILGVTWLTNNLVYQHFGELMSCDSTFGMLNMGFLFVISCLGLNKFYVSFLEVAAQGMAFGTGRSLYPVELIIGFHLHPRDNLLILIRIDSYPTEFVKKVSLSYRLLLKFITLSLPRLGSYLLVIEMRSCFVSLSVPDIIKCSVVTTQELRAIFTTDRYVRALKNAVRKYGQRRSDSKS